MAFLRLPYGSYTPPAGYTPNAPLPSTQRAPTLLDPIVSLVNRIGGYVGGLTYGGQNPFVPVAPVQPPSKPDTGYVPGTDNDLLQQLEGVPAAPKLPVFNVGGSSPTLLSPTPTQGSTSPSLRRAFRRLARAGLRYRA